MRYLIILFLFFLNVNCLEDDIVCPAMQYWSGNECIDCSDACEKCYGSKISDCETCISDFCKTDDYRCVPCEDVKDIMAEMKTVYSNNPSILDKEKQLYDDTRGERLSYNSGGLIIFSAVVIICIIIFISISVIGIVIFLFIKVRQKGTRNQRNAIKVVNEYCNNEMDITKHSKERFSYIKKGSNNAYTLPPINVGNDKIQIPENTFLLNFPTKDLNEGRLLLEYKEGIGCGRFGTVYKCPYIDDGKLIWVAIKVTNYSNMEPAKEIEALLKLNHLNIVELKAVNQKENLILVMPLRKSDLKTFLRHEKSKITEYHQKRYCMQIADACRYMINMEIVHCDLKASNILVVNINHIEITDFGKSERLRQNKGKHVLGTVTHVAMELLGDPTSYTCEATDVWSFGVTMWEIFQYGERMPYVAELSKLKFTEMEILDFLSKGKRLNIPFQLPSNLKRIMITCWIEKHFERPTFNQLFHKFSKSLPEASNITLNNILDESFDKTMAKETHKFF